MAATKFEQRIVNAAIRAQRTYARMADGWWLSHGPEHFLSHEVARSIARGENGNFVYLEVSPRKVQKEWHEPLRGRPPKNQGQRFDILVWQRSADRFKAIIEVKIAWTPTPVIKDAEKLVKHMEVQEAHGTPYLLAYTECYGATRKKRLDRIGKRFEKIEAGCPNGWRLVESRGFAPKGATAEGVDGRIWAWGVGLFRYKKMT